MVRLGSSCELAESAVRRQAMAASGQDGQVQAPNVLVVEHPCVADRLALVRDAATDAAVFRQRLGEIAALVAYEALHDLATRERLVSTPVASYASCRVLAETVLFVPVLRAGLGMVDALLTLVARSEVAHVGIRRDPETLRPEVYLDSLPSNLAHRRVVVCHPVIATGGSVSEVCTMLEARSAPSPIVLSIIASRPGLAAFHERHPKVLVACAAVDPELDERGFVVPGLGDPGDRLFGPPPR